MFWRRRKLPEDEPLVPHGLISQAMEEEASPELPPDMLDSPKGLEQSPPAEPIEMRLRVSAPVQSSQPEPLPEQGRISPPLKWPRVDKAEIARRAQGIDTAVSFPYRRPIVSAAVPDFDASEPEAEISEPAKLEVVETPSAADPIAVAPVAARTEKFKNLLARVRELHLPTVEPLQQRIHSALSQAKAGASTRFQSATSRVQEVGSRTGVALDAAKMRLVDRSNAAIAQSRSGLQHVRENIRGTDLSGARRAWNRMRSWQVTVRIPASNRRLFSFAVETAKSSGVMIRRMVQRDSRLWASMGMAALSALLALGFISVVRHYGPDRVEAQPTSTKVSATAAPTKAQSNPTVSSTPSTTAKSIDPKPSLIAKTSATRPVANVPTPVIAPQKKEVTALSTPKHRVRRTSEEDDYVAKDTYVFYGNAGKPSR